jgi:hypothetical protein
MKKRILFALALFSATAHAPPPAADSPAPATPALKL